MQVVAFGSHRGKIHNDRLPAHKLPTLAFPLCQTIKPKLKPQNFDYLSSLAAHPLPKRLLPPPLFSGSKMVKRKTKIEEKKKLFVSLLFSSKSPPLLLFLSLFTFEVAKQPKENPKFLPLCSLKTSGQRKAKPISFISLISSNPPSEPTQPLCPFSLYSRETCRFQERPAGLFPLATG